MSSSSLFTRPRRKAAHASAALLLAAAAGFWSAPVAPAEAQTVANPYAVKDEAELAQLKYATITDQVLVMTHQQVIGKLTSAKGTVDADNNWQDPAIVTWLEDHDTLVGFSSGGADDNYNPQTAEDRGIHHRLCADTTAPGFWYLLTYMDPSEGYKFGWDAQQMQANAAKYFADLHQNFNAEANAPGLLSVSGGSASYTGWDAPTQTLPACLTAGADYSALNDGTYLARLSHIGLPRANSRIWKTREFEWAQCPPPADPTQTIGLAYMQRVTSTVKTLDGKTVSSSTAPWQYISGCSAPETRFQHILEECRYKFPVGNIDAVNFRTWNQLFQQVPNPDVEPDPKNFNKLWSWQPVTSAQPTLVASGCPGDVPTTPFSDVANSSQTQTKTLACSAVYPSPSPYPQIPYTGTYVEARTVTTTTETLPAGSNPPSISAVTTSPWAVQTNTCSRVYSVTSTQQQTLACPNNETGAIIQARSLTTTTTQYGSGSPATSSSTSATAWNTTSNTCQALVQVCGMIDRNHSSVYGCATIPPGTCTTIMGGQLCAPSSTGSSLAGSSGGGGKTSCNACGHDDNDGTSDSRGDEGPGSG